MAENKKVYVVGHKNPDTDSITRRHNMYWNTLA